MVFEGIRGNGVTGDISIDDVTFDDENACTCKLMNICRISSLHI